MIGSLRGRLAELELGDGAAGAATVVVDVGGVGYEVVLPSRLAAAVGPVGDEVALSVHTHVREGAITLYGFGGPAERRAFRTLVTSPGIGPALAVAILGVHSPASLAQAIAAGDVDALVAVPGVGRKTAQRLVVELAGRLVETAVGRAAPGRPPSGPGDEVAAALTSLGYGPEEVRHGLEALGEVDDVASGLRLALKALAPPR